MTRRERKKADTRKRIITCAMELFKEKGFGDTLMEEVSEKADISKGTLYNYFPDKETILVGFFQSKIADQSNRIEDSLLKEGDIRERLNKLLDFMYDLFVKEPELTAVYFSYRMSRLFDLNPSDNPLRSGLEPYILSIISNAQNNGELRRDMPALLVARHFLVSTMNLFMLNIRQRDSVNMEALKKELIELFLNGAK